MTNKQPDIKEPEVYEYVDPMPYTYTSVIGDWSADGHGASENFTFKTNKTQEELTAIHNSCEGVLGFKIKDICGEYEENELSREIEQALIDASFGDIPNEGRDLYGDMKLWMGPSSVIKLWLKLLEFLDPTCRIELVQQPSWHPRDVPGYGVLGV